MAGPRGGRLVSKGYCHPRAGAFTRAAAAMLRGEDVKSKWMCHQKLQVPGVGRLVSKEW